MGDHPSQETHEEGLSGIFYAWRWACARKKVLLSVAAVATVAVIIFSGLLHGTHLKRVTIVSDGRAVEVTTTKDTVHEVLGEQGVQLGEHDVVSVPLDGKLKDQTTLMIDRALPVKITADGETKEIYTVASTVGEALRDAGVTIGPLDKVLPGLYESVTAETKVKVVRVEKVVEETRHPLPFETVKKEDATLKKGTEKIVQTGQEGVLIKQIEKVYEDGVLVSEEVVARDVQKESKARIVAIGTKTKPAFSNAVAVLSAESQEVTLDGMTFAVKGVLNNVSLTAYSAHFESTGKRKGDESFGITFSGTKVQEGRTIAVDPDVIPMGWWVYIDGIGFRRAEDKGTAVKGKKIDVYFDSESYAQKFGTKRGYTVYLIGPAKPAAS